MNGKTDQHIGFPCVLKERKTSSKNMLIEPRARALLSRPCGSSGKSVTKQALGKRRERHALSEHNLDLSRELESALGSHWGTCFTFGLGCSPLRSGRICHWFELWHFHCTLTGSFQNTHLSGLHKVLCVTVTPLETPTVPGKACAHWVEYSASGMSNQRGANSASGILIWCFKCYFHLSSQRIFT